ncbi:MAG: undecaprenyl/decaprenyl-phosphate alpha-N-acetylglucosaminyl 1-phosphate transferase [Clostridia bacterium]|nr:undecaprenyl/decaprenyl-phosphate alpha-N-acetylglucosaminyl 1-phosphate transferase [Clostridia bacterium]
MWGDISISFLLAFVTAFVITPYTIRLAKKVGAIDKPEKRRINEEPVPRLGGIAVIIGFLLSCTYLLVVMTMEKTFNPFGEEQYFHKLIGILIAIIILGIFCFIDDVKGLPAVVKLIGQVIAATVVVSFGTQIDNINIPFLEQTLNIDNHVYIYIISIGWIVGIINAINLIDGLDGLSSGITLISCLSLIIVFTMNQSPLISIILITALAGAIVGFMPYNIHPAKTFIGDTGAQFLGFALAVISILGTAKTYTLFVLIAPLIILALPIADTLFAIIRRIIKGRSIKAIFAPDTGHLHHKLMKKGYTQKQAVFILYGISACLGMFAIILLESGIWKALSFALMIFAVIAVGYKDFFKVKKDNKKE